jgi:glutathione-regulated potassium-efflux system protein KefB
MAMGAFLAGVLLSESSFRHQLEADVEPFRGILLGLFFMSVGMSLNVPLVLADWPVIAMGVAAFMAVQALAVYGVARFFKADHRESVMRAAHFAQGGEFAFVLYAAAFAVGLIDARIASIMTAIVIFSMALAPRRGGSRQSLKCRATAWRTRAISAGACCLSALAVLPRSSASRCWRAASISR